MPTIHACLIYIQSHTHIRLCAKSKSTHLCTKSEATHLCAKSKATRICAKSEATHLCTKSEATRLCAKSKSPSLCHRQRQSVRGVKVVAPNSHMLIAPHFFPCVPTLS